MTLPLTNSLKPLPCPLKTEVGAGGATVGVMVGWVLSEIVAGAGFAGPGSLSMSEEEGSKSRLPDNN